MVHVEAQEPPPKHEAAPLALILAPTRELVQQIAEEAGKLCEHSKQGQHPRGVWAECVYGGKQRQQQLERTKGCSIISATPGRLSDYLSAGDMTLSRTTYFVLDEADNMVGEDGHRANSLLIKKTMPRTCQCLLFSATFPADVVKFADKMIHNADKILIESDESLVSTGQRKGIFVDSNI